MLEGDQVNELIDNVLAFISNENDLVKELFVEELKEMNKDLSNWNTLSAKRKINLQIGFKEIITMNEIGKLIRNSS